MPAGGVPGTFPSKGVGNAVVVSHDASVSRMGADPADTRQALNARCGCQDVNGYRCSYVSAQVGGEAVAMKHQLFIEVMDSGYLDGVAAMIRDGARLDAVNASEQTLLFHAATWCGPDIVQLLVDAGSDINHQDKWLRTPLHYAVNNDDPRAVDVLLKAGANTELRDSEGQTPLREVLLEPEVLERLLAAGADADAPDNRQNTALHAIVVYHTLVAMPLLLKAGANPNLVNEDGDTPLHVAVGCGVQCPAQAVKLLLAAGADVNAKGAGGRTPLHVAASSDHTEAVVALLEGGADLHARDNQDSTPLHLAAEDVGDEASETIPTLLSAGADVHARDCYGSTPLHCASFWGSETGYLLLALAGADLEARNHAGSTPAELFMASSPSCF